MSGDKQDRRRSREEAHNKIREVVAHAKTNSFKQGMVVAVLPTTNTTNDDGGWLEQRRQTDVWWPNKAVLDRKTTTTLI